MENQPDHKMRSFKLQSSPPHVQHLHANNEGALKASGK